jgi:hypothetical protein
MSRMGIGAGVKYTTATLTVNFKFTHKIIHVHLCIEKKYTNK